MWSESMRLSWYDSAIPINRITKDIPSLERPHSGCIKNFYNATGMVLIRQ